MRTLAIIDSNLTSNQTLIDGIEAEEFFFLDPFADPIDQITSYLESHDNFDTITLYSHGGSGFLQLGSLTLDGEVLRERAEDIRKWGEILGNDINFQIAGCEVALDEIGKNFVNWMSELTGWTISASDDLTGVDGDYELEYTVTQGVYSTKTVALEGDFSNYQSNLAVDDDGTWTPVFDWPLIGVHSILTPDNKVLTFGTDQNGMQGGQWVYDVWDPVTDTHYTLENTTLTNLFCGVAMIVPETGEILISGGDASTLGDFNYGVNDINTFDYETMELTPSPLGEMAYQRWYPTMVTLPTGQLVIMGGIDGKGDGVGTPEIYTPGDGWRELSGAENIDQAENWYYPRAWVTNDGNILYLAADWSDSPVDIYSLDPSGDGSITKIGVLPFTTSYLTPSLRYSEDKVLIMSNGGELWSMDISTATPTFTQISPGQDLPVREWSNMVVLADGKVVISGGSAVDSAAVTDKVVDAVDTVLIFDPDTNTISVGDEAAVARLYHSTTLLLPDATVLSLGGGAPGPLNNLNGEIYKPDYLFNEDGTPAERPVIGDIAGMKPTSEVSLP